MKTKTNNHDIVGDIIIKFKAGVSGLGEFKISPEMKKKIREAKKLAAKNSKFC